MPSTSNSSISASNDVTKEKKTLSKKPGRPLCPNRFYMGLFITTSGLVEAIFLYLSGCVQAIASEWTRNFVVASVSSFLIFWITGGCVLIIYGWRTLCPRFEYQ